MASAAPPDGRRVVAEAGAPPPPSFREALRFWFKLGCISFGGPAGQIAIMHAELVEKRRWVDERHFLDALNFCLLLPGPEAQQLATYLGWLLHRTVGAFAAGILFVLPAALLLWGLSWLYMLYGTLPEVAPALRGLQACVLALIAAALWRLGAKVLRGKFHWCVAAFACVALAWLRAPFPLVIACAALAGWLAGRFRPDWLEGSPAAAPPSADRSPSSWGRTMRVLLIGLALWWGPLCAVGAVFGWQSIFWQQGVFFSKAALVTFGGAYAVLPYVAQEAVTHYQWLELPQMMDGLALAETTPGPLIIVLEFVGFAGAWRSPGALAPWQAGALGAAVTVWATFAPSFLFIFLGAPQVERLRVRAGLQAALAGVSAAVVGVIANLGLWFGAHLLWPAPGRLDVFAAALAAVAFLALRRHWLGVGWVVLLGALAGLAAERLAGW